MPTLERTLVVLPAFNEEEAVADVVRGVIAHLPGARCLVVDDCSTDSTADIAAAAGARVLSLPFRSGVGGALRLGFRYAVELGYDNVIQLDADGQHDPADASRLLEHLDGRDIVIGTRFAGNGSYAVRGPRLWAMKAMSGILSRLAGTRLTDTTSGFKANGPRAVALFARNLPAEYLGDTIDALVTAARAGYTIAEVPVSMHVRAGGRPSHNPGRAAIYLGRAFIALAVALMRPAIPVEPRTAAGNH